MTKKLRFIITLVIAILFIVSVIISTTLCFQNHNQVTLSELVGESNLKIEIELILREKKNDEIKDVIPNTVFYLFEKDGKQIDGIYVTDENGKINTQLLKGEYYFEEITPSIGYTFDEENGEKITKYPFTVEGKDNEKVLIEAFNIRLYGNLLIRKNVENEDKTNLTEKQLNQEFEFNVTFSDNGTYQYSVDDGETTDFTSGSSINLKHGQTASFKDIPIGIMYNITETPKENYIINSSGNSGNITENESIALFTNIYKNVQSISYGGIKISKEVIGENPDLNQEFKFDIKLNNEEKTISLKSGESYTISDLPIGTEYIVTEIDAEEKGYISNVKEYKGNISSTEIINLSFINTLKSENENKFGTLQVTKEVIGKNPDLGKEYTFSIEFFGENAPDSATFKLKKDESISFEQIPYGVTYLVTEIDSAGYESLIDSITGVITDKQIIKINFKNIVPESQQVKLSVTKLLKGKYLEKDNQKEFKFDLIIDNKKTEFTLKNNQTKDFYIPKGSTYQIVEKNYFSEEYSRKYYKWIWYCR